MKNQNPTATTEPQTTIIQISSSKLRGALLFLKEAIARNPLTKNQMLVMRVIGSRLRLSDYSGVMRIELGVLLCQFRDIAIAIEFEPLINLLDWSPEQVLAIHISQQNIKIKVLDNENVGIFTFGAIEIAQYALHEAAEISNCQTIKTSAQQLHTGIKRTKFAASKEKAHNAMPDARLSMTGVLLHIEPQATSFVATDADKLAKYTIKTDQAEPNQAEQKVILSRLLLKLLKPILRQIDLSTEILIRYNSQKIVLNIGFDIEIDINTISCNRFQDYQSVMLFDTPNTLTAKRRDLMFAIGRLSGFIGKDETIIVRLNEEQVFLEARDIERNTNHAKVKLKSTYVGKKMEVHFNKCYLLECLSKIDADEVKIGIQNSNINAVLITPIVAPLPSTDDSTDDGTTTLLLMPQTKFKNN